MEVVGGRYFSESKNTISCGTSSSLALIKDESIHMWFDYFLSFSTNFSLKGCRNSSKPKVRRRYCAWVSRSCEVIYTFEIPA
jgi:hypothetical protein